MTERRLRVGVAQFGSVVGAVEENLTVLLALLGQVDPAQLDVVCFPELCLPGYLLEPAAYDDLLMQELRRADDAVVAAAEAAGVQVVYGTAHADGAQLRNVVVAAGADGRRTYIKAHLAGAERAVFEPGDQLVLTADGAVGLGCCYDLAFAGFSTRLADHGAGVLCYPMAWERERAFVLEALAPARAVENAAYVVCANQTGAFGGLDFYGGSRVVDPLGRTLCRLGDETGVAVAKLDLSWVDQLRHAPAGATFPFALDRRDAQELRAPDAVSLERR